MSGIDYSRKNTTFTDGFGLYHAIVEQTDEPAEDMRTARTLIRKNHDVPKGYRIPLFKISETEYGTVHYSETPHSD